MTRMTRAMREELYDPKRKQHKGSWMDFVKSHKDMRTEKGLLDLKAISKLYHEEKGYDPGWNAGRRNTQWNQVPRYFRQTATQDRQPVKKHHRRTYDVPKLKARLKRLRSMRSEYLKHAPLSQYMGAIKDLKWQIRDARGYDLRIKGKKKKLQSLARHLRKEHPSTKGKMAVFDPNEWIKTKDPFGDSQTKHTWKKGNKYIRLKTMPFSGKWYIRLDNWDGATDTVLKDQVLGKLESNAIKKALEWQRMFDPAPPKSKSYLKRLAAGATRPPKRWFEAMRKGIATQSDVKNPAGIVRRIWDKLSPSKRLQIKRRETAGEPFKYDLPLPDDKSTVGIGTVRIVKPFKLAEVQVNLRVKDYLDALKSGIFSRMKRNDGTTALVARCKSADKNVNVFVDKATSGAT